MNEHRASGIAEPPSAQRPRAGSHPWLHWIVAALVFAGAAGAVAWWQVDRTEERLRTEFLLRARLVSNAIDPGLMASVPFETGKRALPDFQRMNHRLRQLAGVLQSSMAPQVGFVGIYTMRLRDGKIVFGPESISENDHRASPPGTVYAKPPQGLKELFASGQSLIVGPYTDEYGTFVSAFVPLTDGSGRRPETLIGLDVMANDWQHATMAAATSSVGLALASLALLLLSVSVVRANRRIRGQQAVLRESEVRLRAITDSAQDAIVMQDSKGTITFWNPAAAAIFGYGSDEAVGRDFCDLLTPGGFPEVHRAALLHARRDDATGRTVELTVRRKDGQAIIVSFTLSALLIGGERHTAGVLRDITERKQAEAERERAQAMLQSALAQSPAGILIADAPEVSIRWANAAALEIRGDSSLPLTGIEVGRHAEHWQTFRPDGRPYPPEELPLSRAVLKGEITRGEEVIIRKASGEDRWVSVNAAPIRDPNGVITAGIAVFADITEHKRAEEAERHERADRDLLGRVATAAIATQDLAGFQQELLALLGEALDVSRTYIFTYRHDQKTMDNTAEWTAPGVSPQRDHLQGVPADTDWWWIATLMRNEDIRFADIEDIPDERTRAELRAQDIRSILVVPLFIGARYCGFMGFDECRRHRGWTPRERDLLAEGARILMGVWADADLRQSEMRFQGMLRNVSTVAVQGYAMDGSVRYWNRASEALYGYTAEEARGRNLLDLIVPPAMRDGAREAIRRMAETGEAIPASELKLMRKDGSLIPVYSSHALVRMPGQEAELFCIDIDLTDRRRAEAEREQLQVQLAQAQKMESIGRLAGGVAHDFNNMLQAILGNAELALERVGPDDPLRVELEEIRAVSRRSADLTRQLLAFARKQTVAPKVLDLDETVEGMLKMLRRLIGEDIALAWVPGPDLWPVRMDPAQLDQILANLCVNARDAIKGVGKITIETNNAFFDEAHCARHPGFVPGEHVRLAVSDDGCGMDTETLAHLFEPFFTTKEQGRGTGLGLATVYGAVKQNGGFIDVSSTPNLGTTFTIYLPRHAARPAREEKDRAPQAMAHGGETILLVEDEPAILRMTARMLESLGYAVLAAPTPGEALRLARDHAGRIDMVLTDVVMPEMNGRELTRNLLSIHPGLKHLFMSGYTADVIAHRGALDEGTHFLQKPFSIEDLSARVREVLSAPA